MKKGMTTGTLSVPAAHNIKVVSKDALRGRVNALTGQVNELQRRYFRALAPDCEVRTEADRWYLRAIVWAALGLVFPPLLAGTAVCVYRAKKCRKGGEK